MFFKISRKNKIKRKKSAKSLQLMNIKRKLSKNKKKSINKRGGRPGRLDILLDWMMGPEKDNDNKKQRWCDHPLYLEFKQQLVQDTVIENDPKQCEEGTWDKFQAWKALKNGLQLPKDHKWQLITANANHIATNEKHIIWGSIPLKYFFSSDKTGKFTMSNRWEDIDNYYTNIHDIMEDSIRTQESLPEKKPTKNGITIGETTIRKISGPVSFYFLKPNWKVPLDQTHYFPLIMLFGDVHRSKENSCKSCSCSKDSCCYTISDTPFLELIDTLAETYPIDFYTETAFLGMGAGFDEGYMKDFTTGSFMTCYHHVLRNTRKDNCPTKNIRWHAADARFMGLFSSEHYDEYMQSFDTSIVSKKFLDNEYIETHLSELSNLIYEMFKISNNTFEVFYYIYNLYRIINEYVKKTHFKTLNNYLIFIKNLLEGTKTVDEFYEKMSVEIFKIMNKNNSLIEKQINKQTYPQFKVKEYWQNLFQMSLKNNLDSFREIFSDLLLDFEKNFKFIYENLLTFFDKIQDFCQSVNPILLSEEEIVTSVVEGLKWSDNIKHKFQNIPKPLNMTDLLNMNKTDIETRIGDFLEEQEKNDAVSYLISIQLSSQQKILDLVIGYLSEFTIDTIKIYKDLFFMIDKASGVFMDLYAITRIFKQPVEGNRSLLSICYFGDFHIRNIVYLLRQTGLYETSINVVQKKDNRCIDLDNVQLNLNDELYDKY
jgi:hypothetical protein